MGHIGHQVGFGEGVAEMLGVSVETLRRWEVEGRLRLEHQVDGVEDAARLLQAIGPAVAGLDGIANKIDPGKPIDKDLYELPPAEQKKIKQLPGDLGTVLDNLEKSNDWLLKGDVFTSDVIEHWIDYKRKNELDPVRLRPHPWEFALYYDI